MAQPCSIVWFRQDFRLTDNPALTAAAEDGRILPVFIWDPAIDGDWSPGAASRWWLHHSLERLQAQMRGRLVIRHGESRRELRRLCGESGAQAVYWNRRYRKDQRTSDSAIKDALRSDGVRCRTFNASLLWEPWTVRKPDGEPYRVFTPFYRKACLERAGEPPGPLPRPPALRWKSFTGESLAVADLGLMPQPRWDRGRFDHWQPGEEGAAKRLQAFLESGLAGYADGRDWPAANQTSGLAAHLHYGDISPRQVWHAVSGHGEARKLQTDSDAFRRELGWREFCYMLLYHQADLPAVNLDRRFDAFPWRDDAQALRRWQQGQTGIPMVDAGMRELWQTGSMHNRVRMVTASFLVKNLRLDWRHGQAWFWDCLLDADLANNSANWQWVAGCGADAAPYFRIFNPVTQGERFDPDGHYVRRFVPEIAALPDRYLHKPWRAPQRVLDEAGIVLGDDYPEAMIDLKVSRQAALDAFATIKK